MHSSFWPACSPVSARLLSACWFLTSYLRPARCAVLNTHFHAIFAPAPCSTENGLNPAGDSRIKPQFCQFASSQQPLHTLPQLDAHVHPYVRSASAQPHYYRAARRAPYERAVPPRRRARRARQRAVGARLVACRVAWGRPRLAGVPSAPPAASRGWSRASRPATPAASPTASRRTRARCRS